MSLSATSGTDECTPDPSSLARLSEMGIDVYLPRRAPTAAAPPQAIAAASAAPMTQSAAAPSVMAGVMLVAQAQTRQESALLADVERTLRFARIACHVGDGADEATLIEAGALVLFGQAHARRVGASLPAQRQGEVGWVVTGELADLARDAQARRALWSELRRMLRQLTGARDGITKG